MEPDIIYVPLVRHDLPPHYPSSSDSDAQSSDKGQDSDAEIGWSSADSASSSAPSSPHARHDLPSPLPSPSTPATRPKPEGRHNDTGGRSSPADLMFTSPHTRPLSDSRPLSSSSFEPVQRSGLSRHSSLHLYPQHVFPSQLNELPQELEVPYAFSHLQATFHWTREDALTDRKLNIWAQPPCLNCVLVGEGYAQTCNRYLRQEKTWGQTRCCAKCERDGISDGCVEQIEIRLDGSLSHVEDDGTEKSIWGEAEQSLRAMGKVFWTPINLGIGNTNLKKAVVKLWEQEKHSSRVGLPPADLATQRITKQYKKEEATERERLAKLQSRGRELAQEAVADWDEEDLTLEPGRVLAQLAQEERGIIKGPLQESPATNNDHARKMVKEHEYWTNRMRAEAYERREDRLATLGRTAEGGLEQLDAVDTATMQQEERILAQMQVFLARVSQLVDSGVGGEEAVRRSKAELPDDVVMSLEELAPQLFS